MPVYTSELSKSADELLSARISSELRQIGYNPYPRFDEVKDPQARTSDTGPADSNIRFPRRRAEC